MSAHDTTGTAKDRTVVGVFRDRAQAESAIQDLKRAGFTNEQIGVAMRDRGAQKDLTDTTGTGAATGAAAGAVSGGLVGGLIGLLGSLLIPGVGPVVAGGVLASTLVGAGAGAATGGIIGALVGMGLSHEDATHFDTHFRQGGVLVTVNASDRVEEAVRILRAHGADLGPSRMAERETTAGQPAAAGMTDAESRRRDEELVAQNQPADAGDVPVVEEVEVIEEIIVDVPVSSEELQVAGEDVSERRGETPGRRPAYSGRERRGGRDLSYAGPERREATL